MLIQLILQTAWFIERESKYECTQGNIETDSDHSSDKKFPTGHY